ncbi:hypothetical protein GE300_13085 [Rhodobacteraceae bacterium 2CG4]|uniref:Uncharacterized protein n=1 Tax=Halovulum marinum TaxID=2662447 RepID=A0A6L5Z2N7_9RHOB|nr:hypothetical protein [Halovulum marinum]MSU90539.1 hypothetical protein [Halovulum marinum]
MMTALFAFAATVLLLLHFMRNGAFPAVTLAGGGRAAAPELLAPVVGVDNPRIAAAALFHAMITVEGASTAHQRGLLTQMQATFAIDAAEARELALLGAWVANQYASPLQAVPALSARLGQLGGPAPAAQRRIALAIFGNRLPGAVAATLPGA